MGANTVHFIPNVSGSYSRTGGLENKTDEGLRPLPSSILILESEIGYLSLTYVPKWVTMG
jgi:hypothetical protein